LVARDRLNISAAHHLWHGLHLSLLPGRQITIMAAVSHQYVRKPFRIPDPPLLPRRQITIMAAANHQYVRKPLRIPDHQFVGAKYFSPGRRPLVLRNRLTIFAAYHLLHGRNIFRPYVRAWYSVARSPPWALSIINMFAKIFASPIIHLFGRNIFRPDVGHWWRVTARPFLPHIICSTGEKYFAPTFFIGGA